MSVLYYAKDIKEIFSKCVSNIDDNLQIVKISTDTRTIEGGALFVALNGPNYDGHDFIYNAISNGAQCIIVEKLSQEQIQYATEHNVGYIIVENTRKAIHDLAKYRRSKITPKVIAITGSIGKTTSKEFIVAIVKRYSNVEYTKENNNNDLGVCMVMANVQDRTQIVVLELGMDRPGDIEYLSNIVKPDIAIITHISYSHMEYFENAEHLITNKAAICSGMDSAGVVILNTSDKHHDTILTNVKKYSIKNIMRIGVSENCHVRISGHRLENIYTSRFLLYIGSGDTTQMISCMINGTSYSRAFNSMFAMAIARLFKFDLDLSASIISKVPIMEHRGNIIYLSINNKRIHLIDDSYNANPDSMAEAFLNITTIKKHLLPKRTMYFIGDMVELGENSPEMHRNLANIINIDEVDLVYTIGYKMKELHHALPDKIKGRHFQNTRELVNHIRTLVENDDLILFKASNIMKLHQAINKLHQH